MSLEGVLQDAKLAIREEARKAGLDFFEVIFEPVDHNQMNAVAAYGGFPNRYPHWRFGMEYERLSKTYEYGFSKIYEMVINNDPCYAYLVKANSLTDQKIIMAHVYGHSDFFKNNFTFAHSNRKMMDEAGNHRSKIQRLILQYGQDTIEDFIDICLSLENLIDVNSPMRPPDITSKKTVSGEKDILLYLLERGPLADWQQEVLSIIREESYYFTPQKLTKIMNEGWAAYWHSCLMTEHLLTDSEIIDYADRNSAVLCTRSGPLNPYKIGLEIFRDIERRWNTGQFGREFEECDDMHAKANWDKKLGGGREKIFEVRKCHHDVTFIDEFLTPELCERLKLFTYNCNKKESVYEIESRDQDSVRKKLLHMFTNGGNPVMEVANGEKRGHLYLHHVHEGVDLRLDYAKKTMENLYKIWKGPVHVDTTVDGVHKILTFDGTDHHESHTSL